MKRYSGFSIQFLWGKLDDIHLSAKKTFSPLGIFPLIIILGFALLLSGCRSPQISQEEIQITVNVDDQNLPLSIPAGSDVEEALNISEIEITESDRITPPLYTLLAEGEEIEITRVREEFESKEEIIPFERQIVRNESLPEGETRLIQLGQNGLKEITYRSVYEDGVEVSNALVKTVTIHEAQPEITMVGVQAIFAPIPAPGVIAYLSGGNAWLMEDSTANRRPLVTTGDLDGRIFELSPNAGWLLYTRRSEKNPAEEINTLWAVSTTGRPKDPIKLGVSNVVHFAGWRPNGGTRIYYSTVEPRAAAPGWQANNDLYQVSFSAGWSTTPKEIIEANAGGIYGWWGVDFEWSPNGQTLAYARPDGIGTINIATGEFKLLLDITELSTHSDWAWIPGIAWGGDSSTLFTVTHAPSQNLVSLEESPYFDLSAISIANESNIQLSSQTGMFAYPASSPLRPSGKERMYQIAYLQAIFPSQSESSRYRVIVMDRDGSNRRAIFPPENAQGIRPQTPVWAPEAITGQSGDFLALIYQGNLWLVDSGSGQAHQITGDGLISRIDWKSLSSE
jgi:resuscitation-promoting factor RpfB